MLLRTNSYFSSTCKGHVASVQLFHSAASLIQRFNRVSFSRCPLGLSHSVCERAYYCSVQYSNCTPYTNYAVHLFSMYCTL